MSVFAELSLQGEKYLDQQIENAINGVKEMKTVMQKSSEDHKKFLETLEKTKEQKDVRYTSVTYSQWLFIYNSVFLHAVCW